MVSNVQQATIKPLIQRNVAPGTLVHTMSMQFIIDLNHGVTNTRRSVMDAVNMPETKTAMVSVRCTSIRSKGSGRCYVPGSVPIAALVT
jgi:hypothetical protein